MRSLVLALAALVGCQPRTAVDEPGGGTAPWLRAGTSCMVCHDRITTSAGEDVSFGTLWQASMMANSARDPYWQASVRREAFDHPGASSAIEDECSRCHMPMSNEKERAAGGRGHVFANLPDQPDADPLALDGVACSLCHQISPARLGERASFTGGFVIETNSWPAIYGPFDLEPKQTSLMRSALGVVPRRGDHMRQSELCATCHTLFTHTRDAQDRDIGEFPEQVPYLEWLQSEYRTTQSCQSCHMPAVAVPMQIASVAGVARDGIARHDFRGANVLGLGMLDRHRAELAVTAPSAALAAARATTQAFLEHSSARVAITATSYQDATLVADIDVENLGGHKLPTAYPARRAWLHVVVRDAAGAVQFESGKLLATGAIEGNDNDRDPLTFEPHYTEIRSADQVQIYESILGDPKGQVTTGLLTTSQYLKDNRLLPRGFDKTTASPETAVHGDAVRDDDFVGGHDRVRYTVDVARKRPPFAVEVELLYQPVGYRWAHNLGNYPASEARRFVTYYDDMSTATSVPLARAQTEAR